MFLYTPRNSFYGFRLHQNATKKSKKPVFIKMEKIVFFTFFEKIEKNAFFRVF